MSAEAYQPDIHPDPGRPFDAARDLGCGGRRPDAWDARSLRAIEAALRHLMALGDAPDAGSGEGAGDASPQSEQAEAVQAEAVARALVALERLDLERAGSPGQPAGWSRRSRSLIAGELRPLIGSAEMTTPSDRHGQERGNYLDRWLNGERFDFDEEALEDLARCDGVLFRFHALLVASVGERAPSLATIRRALRRVPDSQSHSIDQRVSRSGW